MDSEWQGWLPADGTLLGIAEVNKVWGLADGGPRWRRFEVPPRARSVGAQFQDGIILEAAQLPKASPSPDDELGVTLFWQATQNVEASYVAFVHLLDSNGHLRAQSDHIPDGAVPTYAWSPGEMVPDRHVIRVDGSISPGEYTLIAGMYDSLTHERLPRLDASGPFEADDAVFIGQVLIK